MQNGRRVVFQRDALLQDRTTIEYLYAEGVRLSFEHFDEFTSSDPVSLNQWSEGAGIGSLFCHHRTQRGVSSFAVKKETIRASATHSD
jgi:hypothetical protein